MKKQSSYFLLSVIIFALVNEGCQKELTKKALPGPVAPYYVTILAGGSNSAFQDGTGSSARFGLPIGIAGGGNYIYVADEANSAIRRLTISDGEVITLAGSGAPGGYSDGPGVNAKFRAPTAIAIGPDSNLYIADYLNYKIRKMTPAGLVSTFAGCDSGYVNGPVKSSPGAPMAEFGGIEAIAIAKDGTLFVYDYSATKIRKISTTGIVSDYAGSTRGNQDGSATTAKFDFVQGMAIADDGTLYVATVTGNQIKKISTTGTVTTIAGSTAGYQDGPGLTAKFANPHGVAIAPDGSLYVTDEDNHRIRKISTTGIVSTVAGAYRGTSVAPATSGPGNTALLYYPVGIVILNNTLYFSEVEEVCSLTLP